MPMGPIVAQDFQDAPPERRMTRSDRSLFVLDRGRVTMSAVFAMAADTVTLPFGDTWGIRLKGVTLPAVFAVVGDIVTRSPSARPQS